LKPTSSKTTEYAAPPVTVVVCTTSRLRIQQVVASLKSLESQTFQSVQIVLVVDHNPELAAELKSMVSESTHVTENAGPQGLSGARNTGVAHATGEIVAFIDDDATAEADWIEKLVESYQDERVLGAGGKIVPVWEGGREPPWLPEEFLWTVGCTYRGMPDRGPVRNAIGCNMSFRSSVFEAVGGFNSAIGRLGSKPMGCEETELSIRARKRWPDREILYVPEAVVYHAMPKDRQTVSYFLRRCYSEGTSKAIVRRLAGNSSLNVEGQYTVLTLVPAVFRYLARAATVCLGLSVVVVGFLVGMVRSRGYSAADGEKKGDGSGAAD